MFCRSLSHDLPGTSPGDSGVILRAPVQNAKYSASAKPPEGAHSFLPLFAPQPSSEVSSSPPSSPRPLAVGWLRRTPFAPLPAPQPAEGVVSPTGLANYKRRFFK
jgi:hypothetical protein